MDDCVEVEVEYVFEFVENGDRTVTHTRFTLSMEASFPNSTRNPVRFFGSSTLSGRKSGGTKPAANLITCIEQGRLRRGAKGGSGSRSTGTKSVLDNRDGV